jgi:hypothetical protein
MMIAMRNRWILIAVLWGAACGFFLYNLQTAAKYRKYRQEVATIRALHTFLYEQKREIDASPREVATFYQEVESVDLGLLFLEEQLAALAHTIQLDGFEFTAGKEETAGANSRPVTVKVAGTLRDAIALVNAIERNHPYLMVQGVNATTDAAGGALSYTLTLNYFFKIKAP